MQTISIPWFKCSSDLQAEQGSGSVVLPIRRTPPLLMIKVNSLRYSTCNQVQAKDAHRSHNPANGYDPVRYLLRLIAPFTALVAVSACGPQVPPEPPPPKTCLPCKTFRVNPDADPCVDLPAGWLKATHEGRAYFFSAATGASTWEAPAGAGKRRRILHLAGPLASAETS